MEICVDGTHAKGAKKKLSSDKKKMEGKKAGSGNADHAEDDLLDDHQGDAMDDVLHAEIVGADTVDSSIPSPAPTDDVSVATDAALLSEDLGNRRLLGGVMRTLLASAGGDGPCPLGQESFWSIRAIHETHIFIFVLAVVHIIYAGVSMVLCAWKVGVTCLCLWSPQFRFGNRTQSRRTGLVGGGWPVSSARWWYHNARRKSQGNHLV